LKTEDLDLDLALLDLLQVCTTLYVRYESWSQKTRVPVLRSGENHLIVFCYFDFIPACDGRTDGRTDRHAADVALYHSQA